MIYKTNSPRTDHTRVTFELPATIWAARIGVIVERPPAPARVKALTQARDGAWRTNLDLPSHHHYHFHYLVDGQWTTDAQADGFATTSQGDPRSLLATTGVEWSPA